MACRRSLWILFMRFDFIYQTDDRDDSLYKHHKYRQCKCNTMHREVGLISQCNRKEQEHSQQK